MPPGARRSCGLTSSRPQLAARCDSDVLDATRRSSRSFTRAARFRVGRGALSPSVFALSLSARPPARNLPQRAFFSRSHLCVKAGIVEDVSNQMKEAMKSKVAGGFLARSFPSASVAVAAAGAVLQKRPGATASQRHTLISHAELGAPRRPPEHARRVPDGDEGGEGLAGTELQQCGSPPSDRSRPLAAPPLPQNNAETLTDDRAVETLRKMAKQRLDSIAQFRQARLTHPRGRLVIPREAHAHASPPSRRTGGERGNGAGGGERVRRGLGLSCRVALCPTCTSPDRSAFLGTAPGSQSSSRSARSSPTRRPRASGSRRLSSRLGRPSPGRSER